MGSERITDRGELHRGAQLGLVDHDVVVVRQLDARHRAAPHQLEQHGHVLGVERVGVVHRRARIEPPPVERDQPIGVDVRERLLGRGRELDPGVRHRRCDRAAR